MSKYNARKTIIDGITFDSKAEANYYTQLKLLQRAGEIVELELQPKFEIIPSFVDPAGKKVRATHYIADFRVKYKDGREEVIDVKGHKTDVYRLKKKLFEQRYGIPVKEVSG